MKAWALLGYQPRNQAWVAETEMKEPMLAEAYDGELDVAGWWMSEKLDGVRSKWTGRQFRSRNGTVFHAPKWFTAQLPQSKLDGELWMGRGRFQSTIAALRRLVPVDAEWQRIRYMVFAVPEVATGIEDEMAFAQAQLQGCQVARVVPQSVCRNREHLERFYSKLCKLGAEGVMLRESGSPYVHGHSYALLKYKPVHTNEAKVIAHTQGEGKYAGLLGALVCRWRGVQFHVGTGLSDRDRARPPRVGSRVTFRCGGFTDAGVPRFPAFVAVRDYE